MGTSIFGSHEKAPASVARRSSGAVGRRCRDLSSALRRGSVGRNCGGTLTCDASSKSKAKPMRSGSSHRATDERDADRQRAIDVARRDRDVGPTADRRGRGRSNEGREVASEVTANGIGQPRRTVRRRDDRIEVLQQIAEPLLRRPGSRPPGSGCRPDRSAAGRLGVLEDLRVPRQVRIVRPPSMSWLASLNPISVREVLRVARGRCTSRR